MLAACAARLRGDTGLVWVDLGGGTGENVDMMSKYMDLSSFDKIYIVDITPSLCKVAAKKAIDKGWKNVVVVEGDACTFKPEEKVTLVTFSYSLSSKFLLPGTLAASCALSVDPALNLLKLVHPNAAVLLEHVFLVIFVSCSHVICFISQ